MASTFGSKAPSSEIGADFGKFESESTASTCLPAPISKSDSVALGDSEIIRVGFLAIVVEYPPEEIVSGYFVAVLAALADESGASNSVVTKSAIGRTYFLNIKNSLKIFEGERGQLNEWFRVKAQPSSEVG
jgi:hypothetical protein